MYSLLPVAIQTLLTSILWTDTNDATTPLRFQLRHEHAVSNASRVVFSDTVPSLVPEVYGVNTRRVVSHRPSSMPAFSNARLRSLRHAQNDALLWKESDILGPNVKERETLLTLAKMTSNAYNQPADKAWYDLDSNWNSVSNISFLQYLKLTLESSRIPSVGNQMQTDSVDMSLCLTTTLLLSYLSKAPLQDGSQAVQVQQ
jgi:hypothetical protein